MHAWQRQAQCLGDFPFRQENAKMLFSDTYWTQNPQLINIKFCTFDYYGEISKSAENGYYPLARARPPR